MQWLMQRWVTFLMNNYPWSGLFAHIWFSQDRKKNWCLFSLIPLSRKESFPRNPVPMNIFSVPLQRWCHMAAREKAADAEKNVVKSEEESLP